jgi:hypothetical protein
MGDAVIIEVIRQLMTLAFSIAETNNLSEEEIENLRKASYEEVKKRNPQDLPIV